MNHLFSRQNRKKRTQYLYDMFTPDNCRKINKNKCTSSIYLEKCKWVSKTRKYCRKRKNIRR